MKTVHVVGIGLGPEDMGPRAMAAVNRADVLAGGVRHLDYFPGHPGGRLPLSGKLSDWIDRVARAAADQTVAVLASGDPNFYGVAQRIVAAVGPDHVVIHPNVTAVQAAFARLKATWRDAAVVSLHGRDERPLWNGLSRSSTVALYTDRDRSPDRIAALMLERGLTNWRLWVLEDLGTQNERTAAYTLEEAARNRFSDLNMVVLVRTRDPEPLFAGLPDDCYEHEAGMITKSEVRTIILGRLRLERDSVLWDLGAGCGSVGIEASLLAADGLIAAVEKNPDRIRHIRANRARFNAAHVEVFHLELPQGMDGLPDPDRIFVGGGGDAIAAIIRQGAQRLPTGGILTASAVQLGTLEAARAAMNDTLDEVEVIQASISRGRAIARDQYLQALNPVWILTGIKRKR